MICVECRNNKHEQCKGCTCQHRHVDVVPEEESA